jgi:hypothetical protein
MENFSAEILWTKMLHIMETLDQGHTHPLPAGNQTRASTVGASTLAKSYLNSLLIKFGICKSS